MAKLSKEIKSAVRLNGETFIAGREDDLEAALTAEQGKRLLDKGAIEGDWKFGTPVEPAKDESGDDEPKLDADIEEKLQAAFDGPEAVQAASDDEILAIEGIGKASLKKIREAYPASA